jgi:exopolysaccharide production protein ExoZ
MANRLKSIDVLRGLAASAVVLRHSDDRFLFGSIGVDFFFVISGFVMAQLFRDRTASRFLFDRAWRIFPIYWVALLPWFFVRGAGGENVTPAGSFASTLLLPNWFGVYGTYLGVAWTLLFELLFYLGVALAIRFGNFLLPVLIFAAALIARPYADLPLLHFLGSPMIFEFLFGVAIARLPLHRLAGLALMAAGILWLALFPNSGLEDYRVAMSYGPSVGRVLLWGIPAAAIVYGALTMERAFKGRLVDGLLVLGAASYSVYLVHTLVTKNVILWWPAEFALALAAGIALWWTVERPILAHKPKWFASRKPAPAPAAVPAAQPIG